MVVMDRFLVSGGCADQFSGLWGCAGYVSGLSGIHWSVVCSLGCVLGLASFFSFWAVCLPVFWSLKGDYFF